MSISSQYDAQAKLLTITVRGRLDFKVQKQFRQAYEKEDVQPALVRVDLEGTEYMDSSGLGMLLLLRDHFSTTSPKIVLSKPSDELSKVLEIANFNKLFIIE
ncbi:MAG: STAS domain-containing protein [Halothiobacillaceae bacterium]